MVVGLLGEGTEKGTTRRGQFPSLASNPWVCGVAVLQPLILQVYHI